MAKDPSFDVVSEMNMEEVKNSVQMTVKELTNRFDFKGSTVDIKLENQKFYSKSPMGFLPSLLQHRIYLLKKIALSLGM